MSRNVPANFTELDEYSIGAVLGRRLSAAKYAEEPVLARMELGQDSIQAFPHLRLKRRVLGSQVGLGENDHLPLPIKSELEGLVPGHHLRERKRDCPWCCFHYSHSLQEYLVGNGWLLLLV
jgi:hypothetical protein